MISSVPAFSRTNFWSALHGRLSASTLALTSIFVLALVLRLGWIDAHGYWTDEVSSIETARLGLPFVFAHHFGWVGNQTPWHYALVWLLIQPLDPATSPVLVRLPSVLAGAFLVPVVYGLGRELFSRMAGLLAALMTALAPVLLDHSHDARPYSMFAFLTAASVFCLVMAERTGKSGWWLGFIASMSANLLDTYLAATLVLPSLVPYFVWLLWRAWVGRRQAGGLRRFIAPVLSLGVVAVVGGLMLLEYLRLPAAPIAWDKLSASSLAIVPVNVFASFTDLGISGSLASVVSLGLLLLAGLGVCAALLNRQGRGLLICVPICLLPALAMTILSTSNLVFARYILFVGPFYFLLIANAVATAAQTRPRTEEAAQPFRWLRPTGVTLSWALVALYTLSAFNYVNPATHEKLSYRPDFRGVAQYLSQSARPQDAIILADYPAHGYSVTNFYWNHRPPAPLYDARDPRLYHAQMQGNIYWVLSLLDVQLMDRLAAPDQGWIEVVHLESVIVLKEASSGRSADQIVEGMAKRLDTLSPGFAPTRILWGSVQQARGDAAAAAQSYQSAYTGFLTGDVYLRTAQGNEAAGLTDNAWQEGIISKAMEPYRPQVHDWLAQQLRRDGYPDESTLEGKIAQLLRANADASAR